MRQSRQQDYLEFDVDQLESRRMLAGNVAASITNAGDLVITGDNSDNVVSVTFSENEVVVTGKDGTLILGEAAQTLAIESGLRDIKIRMKGGDDFVAIDGSGASTFRNAKVAMGSGADSFVFGYVVLTGNASISLGSARNEASQAATFSFSTIGGNLKVSGSSAEDVVTFNFGVSVGAKTKINLSGGDDSLHINYSSVSFSGSVFANGGAGDDDVVEDFGTHAIPPRYRGFEN